MEVTRVPPGRPSRTTSGTTGWESLPYSYEIENENTICAWIHKLSLKHISKTELPRAGMMASVANAGQTALVKTSCFAEGSATVMRNAYARVQLSRW